jgi:DNA sulfur modification protein DndD
MLLKSIKLHNFRQFIGTQEIAFATDKDKNVTVLLGENGSGKTSLAQAFTWCLYGETDFSDKILLNKKVAFNMPKREIELVKVELNLIHNMVEYTIQREQEYQKNNNDELKQKPVVFKIFYKKDGQQEFLSPIESLSRMKEILPVELSRYFFFDGERIGNLSKEILKGRSKEFAEAVRGLLGLNSFISALSHLNPRAKYSVIGHYNQSYDASSDNKISEFTKKLDAIQSELDYAEKRISDIEIQVEVAQDECEKLQDIIRKNAKADELQKQKNNLKRDIKKKEEAYNSTLQALPRILSKNPSSYFAKSMIQRVIVELSKREKIDKGVPDIHARTIEFLIKRGKCICGQQIETGNDAYMQLNEMLKFIPPQSIGTSIKHFVNESEIRTKNAPNLLEAIGDQVRIASGYESDIDQMNSDVQILEKDLQGVENISAFQSKLMQYEAQIRKLNTEKDALNNKKGAWTSEHGRYEKARKDLTLRDAKNRKIEVYKTYANHIHDTLKDVYQKNEDEVRGRLERYINEIFKSIYKGGLSLTVDEKYNIQVLLDEASGHGHDIETSTAQSISVIFAFISGIIKMARENSATSVNDTIGLDSEPYPLVMDAPLSAFDKTRIQSVCDELPRTAEQVIIFIKDTDGEIAEEHMSLKVGERYELVKSNEIETNITAR